MMRRVFRQSTLPRENIGDVKRGADADADASASVWRVCVAVTEPGLVSVLSLVHALLNGPAFFLTCDLSVLFCCSRRLLSLIPMRDKVHITYPAFVSYSIWSGWAVICHVTC